MTDDAESLPPAPAPVASPPARPLARGAFGTSLHLADLIAATAVTVTVFLFWGGALWLCARGTQHVGRFVYSYALAIPLLVALHLWRLRGRIDWGSLAASTFLVWSLKFVVTVPLYHLLAPTVAPRIVPRDAPAGAGEVSAPAYAASSTFTGTTLRGRVVDAAGAPIAGAAVWLDDVSEGRRAEPRTGGATLEVHIAGGRLDPRLATATVGETLAAANRDPVRHLLHGRADGRSLLQRPLPPVQGAERIAPRVAIPVREPGRIELSCDPAAPCGRAWILVFRHPYHAITGEDGHFELAHAPSAPRFAVARVRGASLVQSRPRVERGALGLTLGVTNELP